MKIARSNQNYLNYSSWIRNVILILFDLRQKKKIQDRKRDEKIHFRVFVTRYFFKQSIRNTDWPGYRLFLAFFFPGNFPPDGNPSPITENQAAPMKIFAIFFFLAKSIFTTCLKFAKKDVVVNFESLAALWSKPESTSPPIVVERASTLA